MRHFDIDQLSSAGPLSATCSHIRLSENLALTVVRRIRRYNTTQAMLNAANVSTRGVIKYFGVSEDTAHRCSDACLADCAADLQQCYPPPDSVLLQLHLRAGLNCCVTYLNTTSRFCPLCRIAVRIVLSCSIMTLGCDFDITQLVDNNLGYHVCCYKVRLLGLGAA